MSYAKVVLGLPIEGPFDYAVNQKQEAGLREGFRVRVSFGFKKMTGYVVGLSPKSKIKKVKPILKIIDSEPVFNKNLFSLARKISDYYCCSLGEALDAALPLAVRNGRQVMPAGSQKPPENGAVSPKTFLQAGLSSERYLEYINKVHKKLSEGKNSIVLFPDSVSASEFKKLVDDKLGIDASLLLRNEADELQNWMKVRSEQSRLVVGTRAAIFAPFSSASLIIVDDENNPAYKQEQSPHYHARQVALMRSGIDNAELVFGGVIPSFESQLLIQRDEFSLVSVGNQDLGPEVKIIDMKSEFSKKDKGLVLSRYLIDAVNASLASKEKVLLLLNRRGFATYSFCHNCKAPLVCPRCNLNLVYYFEENILACNHCNFKMPLPGICPKCNAGYIKFRGAGTEKLESEIARIFPQAEIGKDIIISTSAVFKRSDVLFSLTCILNIDNSLSMPDFRSGEKIFGLLLQLKAITKNKLIIQTKAPANPVFMALGKNKPEIFHKDELKQRKFLKLPPYKHLALIRVRSKKEDLAKSAAELLFGKLKSNVPKNIEVISVNVGTPAKLRGNFYWQILLRSSRAEEISSFIKNNLKDFRHSGIIVSVDIDPL